MKTSSAKAKGRRLQQFVGKKIAELLDIKYGKDELIDSRPMGQSGKDVILIGKAKELFPFDVECKMQEKWSVPQWIEQAKSNTEEGRDWLVVCSKNRYQTIAILDFETLLSLIKRNMK